MKKATVKQIKDFLDINMQQLVAASTFGNDANIDKLLLSLQKKLLLKSYPYKIVCLDISHLSGKNTSGGLSCMLGGFLSKSSYRQFKIPPEHAGDDYASIEFVINSYFGLSSTLKKNTDVNLFVIDGGKGQLNIVKKIYEKNEKFSNLFDKIDFISIGKGKARELKNKLKGEKEKVFIMTDDLQIYDNDIDYKSLEDKLLLKLRDESHRFANRYRKIQSKTIKK